MKFYANNGNRVTLEGLADGQTGAPIPSPSVALMVRDHDGADLLAAQVALVDEGDGQTFSAVVPWGDLSPAQPLGALIQLVATVVAAGFEDAEFVAWARVGERTD